jgi:hypothetical protein
MEVLVILSLLLLVSCNCGCGDSYKFEKKVDCTLNGKTESFKNPRRYRINGNGTEIRMENGSVYEFGPNVPCVYSKVKVAL